MTTILPEAPIVHGNILLSALQVGASVTFDDGSSFTGIDQVLDPNSSNPVIASAFLGEVERTVNPPATSFAQELLIESPNGSGTFDRQAANVNSFGSGGASVVSGGITVPASGTYAVGASYASDNGPAVVHILLNTATILATMRGKRTSFNGSFRLDAGDVLSTANTGAHSMKMNFTAALIRADERITAPAASVADGALPIITLTGPADVTIERLSTYIDQGAIAVDGSVNLTSSIVASSTVNAAVSGTYSVSYNVTDAAGNAAVEVVRTVRVSDTVAPVIALLGAAAVTTHANFVYTDAGATALDGDTDVTSSIVVTSTVDTSKPGTYHVHYNVADSAGNSALQVTRTVSVVDTTPPIIMLIGPSSVTIERLSTYVDQGTTVDDLKGSDLSSSIVATSNVDTAMTGTYNVTYNVTDASGNAAVEILRIVTVTDTVAPVLAMLGAASVQVDQGETYVDAGSTAFDGDTDLTPSIVVTTTVDTTTPGTYHVHYNVDDASGNSALQVTRSVQVMPPQPVLTTTDPATVTQVVETEFALEGTVDDYGTAERDALAETVAEGAGVDADDVTIAISEGSIIVTATIAVQDDVQAQAAISSLASGLLSDAPTLQTTLRSKFIERGSSAPVPTVQTIRKAPVKKPVRVIDSTIFVERGSVYVDPGITATNAVGEDLSARTSVTYKDTRGVERPLPAGGITETETGTMRVYYNLVDQYGNAAAGVIRNVVVVDTINPSVSISGSNPHTIERGSTYTDAGATAQDVDASGNATVLIATSSSTVNPSATGTYTVTYSATDLAGNTSQASRTVIVVDTTPPVIALVGPASVTIERLSTYVDQGATAANGGTEDLTSSIVASLTVDTSVSGTYSVTYNVSDASGNAAIPKVRTVSVADTVAPVLTMLGAASVTIEAGSAFPSGAMTANTTTLADGTYTASASSFYSNEFPPFHAFDKNPTTRFATANVSANLYNSSTGYYAGTTTTTVDGVSVAGEWIELIMPSNATCTRIDISPTSTHAHQRSPRSFVVVASVNGSWMKVLDKTGVQDWAQSQTKTFSFSSTVASTTYRLIAREVGNLTSGGQFQQHLYFTGMQYHDSVDYEDDGATAVDGDTDLTSSIVATSTVNPSVPGTYYVHYNVSDASGNSALQVTRTVVVAPIHWSTAELDPSAFVVTASSNTDYGPWSNTPWFFSSDALFDNNADTILSAYLENGTAFQEFDTQVVIEVSGFVVSPAGWSAGSTNNGYTRFFRQYTLLYKNGEADAWIVAGILIVDNSPTTLDKIPMTFNTVRSRYFRLVIDGKPPSATYGPVIGHFALTHLGAWWSPAQLTTLAWYDADDASTITLVSGKVSQWNDKSGNDRNVSQSTSARQPAYVTNGVGGKASLSFDSSGLQFNFADTVASDYTAMFVLDVFVNSSTINYLIDVTSGRMLFASKADGFSPAFYNGGLWKGPPLNITGKVMFEFVAASPSITIYRDGTQVFSDATHYTNRMAFNNLGCIGARLSADSGFYNGLIAEIVIVPTGLIASDRQKLEGYLAHKWGLAANLPSDHPHKNAAP